MKIAIATDAWLPQTNGVVTTIENTVKYLQGKGHEVCLITSEPFKTVPLPTYSSIRLAIFPYRKIAKMLKNFNPDAIHIATEGPIGLAVRRYCIKHKLKFTSSYHTQYPEYIQLRFPVPCWISYRYFRWFHKAAKRTMVSTLSMQQRLNAWRFKNIVLWSRGVDTELFQPGQQTFVHKKEPVFIFAGRIAIEKNIEAFLSLNLPGKKQVVGDGPDMIMLQKKYPDVTFTGFLHGKALARQISSSDVFIFPSKTDTFGLVMLEAMSCGVPVAAYPVTGPKDIVIDGETGCLDKDLQTAAINALKINRNNPRQFALKHSWTEASKQFFNNLAPNHKNAN